MPYSEMEGGRVSGGRESKWWKGGREGG